MKSERRLDLSRGALNTLIALFECQPATIERLARHIPAAFPSAHSYVKALHESGLIEKERRGRAWDWQLTERGFRVAAHLRGAAIALNGRGGAA